MMTTGPSKISQFWQELKRRNVVRVITVYAGASFVILDLLDIITEPLKLPSWLLPVVIVLLSIGFIIAIILSWIYDIHPEGGMVKTGAADRIEEKEPKSSKGWKIASYISFIVIVGLIVLNILPGKQPSEIKSLPEKSIAVLPFINDSPDKENEYFMNGIMEELLIKLQTIENLSVRSRSTVEQFRDQNRPSIPEIAEKLGVNYIVEGSGQKYGNTLILRVQLIQGSEDDHLWAKSYEEKVESSEMLRIPGEIAESIASELEAVITPEEMERIDRIPTFNLTAYDYYMQAENYLWDYLNGSKDSLLLNEAQRLYQTAIDHEPTFARAYLGLAKVYWEKNFWNEFLDPDFMAVANAYIDKAFYYDDQLDEVYLLRGKYFEAINDTLTAINLFREALRLNPNSWEAYQNIGNLYINYDNLKSIQNLLKAAELYQGPHTTQIMKNISYAFAMSGFYDLSKQFWGKALELNNDSVGYFSRLADNENWAGNFQESIRLCFEALYIDSTNRTVIDRLAYNYLLTRDYENAYAYYKKIEPVSWSKARETHRFALVYWYVGKVEEAENLFQIKEQSLLDLIELRGAINPFSYYDLAGIYAFRGEGQKALEYLERFNTIPRVYEWIVTLIKNDPLFDNIRDEPRFKQIVRDLEAKYQAEHERVRQWLEENEML